MKKVTNEQKADIKNILEEKIEKMPAIKFTDFLAYAKKSVKKNE